MSNIEFLPFTNDYINSVEKTPGVYMIKNILNNKYYIGSSMNIRRRLQCHSSKLNRQTHHNLHLQYAFNKYGRKAFVFSILETCEPIIDTLIFLEQKYLDLKPEYNISPTAYSNCGYHHTLSARRKMSKSRTGKARLVNKTDYAQPKSIKNKNYQHKERFVPVCQYDLEGNLLNEYESVSEAARSINRLRHGIRDACTGKQLTAYGYIWKYKNKETI